MTSRQRVEIALDHREPDRVPLDLTIVARPYKELIEYLNISDDYWWDDWAHVFPTPEVLEKLNVDVFHIPYGITVPEMWDKHCEFFKDEWGYTKQRIDDGKGGFLYQMIDHPLAGAQSVDDIMDYDWPDMDEPRVEGLEEYVRRLYNETDFALTLTFGGNIFELSHYLRGMENFFIDLIANPEMACAVMDKILEIRLHRDKQVLQAVGKYLTYFRFQGEDLGSQRSPLISPDTFRELVKPRLQTEWRAAKAEYLIHNPKGKISVHSCGAVFDFMEDFIEMGADMLNPVQPNAVGMDTELIKKTFGERLCFHGAVNTQDALSNGTVLDIVQEVKTRIEHLAPGGGYILSPSHNIQSGVAPEKIIAMYAAAVEFGRY
jgi:uroporphyrinogen decarboxylase